MRDINIDMLEMIELSWTGLKPTTTRFLGQCSTN